MPVPTQAEIDAAQAIIDAAKAPVAFTPFDETQQKKVNDLIVAAKSEAAKQLRAEHAELKTQTDSLQAALDAAKADLAKAKTKGEKGDASADIEALRAEMASVAANHKSEVERITLGANAKAKEASDARAELARTHKDLAVTAAANSQNFYDPAAVAKLTSDHIVLNDEGKYVVLNDQGQPRMNALYEPMSLPEFYAEYAEKNKWQVRGEVKGGAGSSQRTGLTTNGRYELHQVFGPKFVPAIAAEVAKDMVNYRRMKAQAISAGLIPA